MPKINKEIKKIEQGNAWNAEDEVVEIHVKKPLEKIIMDQNKANPINPQVLVDLVTIKMPFGKYKDYVLCDLPEPYLVWFYQKGFPPGKIGALLAALYEIKLNGLGYLLKPIRKTEQ